MALIVTPGSATADSFATLDEANLYHAARTPVLAGWEGASTAEKEGALRTTAVYLGAMPRAWLGAAVDAVQALSFPRSGLVTRNGFALATVGASSIPPDLKNAQIEWAGQLIEEDRTGDDTTLSGIRSVDVDGAVSVEFEARSGTRVALQRRDSLETMVPDLVILLLVPSWLKDVRDEDQYAGNFFVDSLEN